MTAQKRCTGPTTAAVTLVGLVGLATGALGCAHQAPRARLPEVTFDEMVITGDTELSALDDDELFARGTAAYAVQDFRLAARAFGRLCDAHPDSAHRRSALYNSGLALEKLGRWEEALTRFVELADPLRGSGDAQDAAFRQAEVLYHLGRHDEAAVVLKTLADRPELSVDKRIEARVQQGVCEVEAGRIDAAEGTLRAVVAFWQGLPDRDLVDEFFPAQAQFFLGEILRMRYEAVILDANAQVEQLAKALEYKSELLLSAQGHYLRAIRMGNGHWATASGQRVGRLYEDMYQHLLQAPAPRELTEAEQEAYREELRKRIRVLITKAITVYEHTLQAAERIGASNPFVEETKASLKHMKDLLLEDARAEDAGGPSSQPPGS